MIPQSSSPTAITTPGKRRRAPLAGAVRPFLPSGFPIITQPYSNVACECPAFEIAKLLMRRLDQIARDGPQEGLRGGLQNAPPRPLGADHFSRCLRVKIVYN